MKAIGQNIRRNRFIAYILSEISNASEKALKHKSKCNTDKPINRCRIRFQIFISLPTMHVIHVVANPAQVHNGTTTSRLSCTPKDKEQERVTSRHIRSVQFASIRGMHLRRQVPCIRGCRPTPWCLNPITDFGGDGSVRGFGAVIYVQIVMLVAFRLDLSRWEIACKYY